MAQVTIRFKDKEIIAKVVKEEHHYDEVDGVYRMRYKIMVKCGSHRHYFYFHDSAYNYKQGKYKLNSHDLMHALECHVSDALYFIEYDDIEAFMQFVDDEKEAKRCYEGCKKAYEKLMKIFDNEDELYEFHEFLTQKIEILEKLSE